MKLFQEHFDVNIFKSQFCLPFYRIYIIEPSYSISFAIGNVRKFMDYGIWHIWNCCKNTFMQLFSKVSFVYYFIEYMQLNPELLNLFPSEMSENSWTTDIHILYLFVPFVRHPKETIGLWAKDFERQKFDWFIYLCTENSPWGLEYISRAYLSPQFWSSHPRRE